MDGGLPLQMFSALGQVTGEDVYAFPMTEQFIPFRRNVAYRAARPAPIQPLIPRLSFIKDPRRWGYPLRAGHV